MDTLRNNRRLALQLLQLANRYADSVIFWNNSHRQVLRQYLKLIRMLMRPRKKLRRRGCVVRKQTLRGMKGSLAFLLKEPVVYSKLEYFKYLKMPGECFHQILSLIQNDIGIRDSKSTSAVTGEEQLGLTVRGLSTGETHLVLSQQSHISRAFVSVCIPRVCKAIWNNMENIYLKFPDSMSQWEAIASEFERKYQFPRCVGALKFKRLQVKKTRSVVLVALADANCKLLYAHVIYEDQIKEAEEILHCKLRKVLGHSQSDQSTGQPFQLPYVTVTNSEFSEHNYLLKPYAANTTDVRKCAFNERLERACQAVETLFAVLLTRFRQLHKKIFLQDICRVQLMANACCVLHNFLLQHYSQYTNIQGVPLPEDSDTEFTYDNFDLPVAQQAENDFHRTREAFLEYFNNENIN